MNKTVIAINQFATKQFSLPIDVLGGQNYRDYTQELLGANRELARRGAISPDRHLGVILYDITLIAIREEIFYRWLMEGIVLPYFFPQFAIFSIARTCVISLIFASSHLLNLGLPKQALAAQFFHTFVLGMICSLAREKFGLFGAIGVHSGFNLYGWKYMFNQTFSDVSKKVRSIELIDIIHPGKIVCLIVISFVDDCLKPFILAYLAYKVINSSLKQSEVIA